jgi:hypothetical protein
MSLSLTQHSFAASLLKRCSKTSTEHNYSLALLIGTSYSFNNELNVNQGENHHVEQTRR